METTNTTDVNTQPTAEVEVTSASEKQESTTDESLDKFWDEDAEDVEEKGSEEDEAEEADSKQNKQEPSRGERRREELNDEIRTLTARRSDLQREISQYEEIRQAQQDIDSNRVTPEQLMEAGLDEQDAQIQALLHNQKVDAQNREFQQIQQDIAELQYNLRLDMIEAARDYPVFDSNSESFDQEFSDMALEMYEEIAHLQLNADGAPISAEAKLYPFLQKLATIREKGYELGAKERQKAIHRQNASVMESGGSQSVSSDDTKDFVKNFFN